MNYTIFTLGNRPGYVNGIRRSLSQGVLWSEKGNNAIDASNDTSLDAAKRFFDFCSVDINWREDEPGPKRGHLGIWYAVLSTIAGLGSPLVTFEDDAILANNFSTCFFLTAIDLPRETDAFSLFLPRDQDHVYYKGKSKGGLITPAYQRYGGVSMLWTPKGAERFWDLVRKDGITDQWDNQLYAYGRDGEMEVYTQPPTAPILVSITGREPSIVQETDYAILS